MSSCDIRPPVCEAHTRHDLEFILRHTVSLLENVYRLRRVWWSNEMSHMAGASCSLLSRLRLMAEWLSKAHGHTVDWWQHSGERQGEERGGSWTVGAPTANAGMASVSLAPAWHWARRQVAGRSRGAQGSSAAARACHTAGEGHRRWSPWGETQRGDVVEKGVGASKFEVHRE